MDNNYIKIFETILKILEAQDKMNTTFVIAYVIQMVWLTILTIAYIYHVV